jgi:hypothetical protein
VTRVGAIPDTLRELVVPIDSLKLYERNPRRGDVETLKRSLERNGQYRPLVVNARTREVLAGNHTLQAARELGWTDVAVTFVDVDEEQAKRIVLVDNRSSDLAVYDDRELTALLRSLPDVIGTGWREDELDALLSEFADEAPLDDEREESELERERGERYSFGVYSEDAIIESAFRWFRENGFPYRSLPLHRCMVEINALHAMEDERLPQTLLGYHVADTYHPHRWHAHIGKQPNAIDNFENDERLEEALRHVTEYGHTWSPISFASMIGLTHGAQFVSNFRPGYALWLLRRYAKPGAVVLDASAGYGGRLTGFLASDCSTYIGIDPATETQRANERLVADLCPPTKRVELVVLPAEDVEPDFRADVAVTSPPYFRKERYSDEETQSWRRYATPEDWREGFLRPLLALQHRALKRGGTNVLNIADVKVESVGLVPLVDWALEDARELFDVVAIETLPLRRRWGRWNPPGAGEEVVSEVATEPVLVMRKR